MKNIYSMFIILAFCFGFVGVVNAEEADLSTIASINVTIGNSDDEILPLGDSGSSYTFYYKYVKIDSTDFDKYVNSKYIMENSDDSSDSYADATSEVKSYEEGFSSIIPTVSSATDLNEWTKSTDNQIKVSNLSYEKGKHNGYVLAVAGIKDGDSKIYVTRLILESKSTSTLGQITYLDSDKTDVASSDGNQASNTENVNTGSDTATKSNPKTGVEDYVIYLVPVSIILGSAILLRKNFVYN